MSKDASIYAGIDEAGYGPMFGPLTVSCAILAVPITQQGPGLWDALDTAVCRTLSEQRARRGRGSGGAIVVNDSKKLHTRATGIRHLERGVLAFAAAGGMRPDCLDSWLDQIGDQTFKHDAQDPWYAMPTAWPRLPVTITTGEIAVAGAQLKRCMDAVDVTMVDWRIAVVLEDRFNRMVSQSQSKAATSFSFVAKHLDFLWRHHADNEGGVHVVVDRQSGRKHYRELLATIWRDAQLQVLDESQTQSVYRLSQGSRSMQVSFQVQAEQQHLPVALASMNAKYVRELFMHRFQTFFSHHAPDVKPTAGYASDAKRFWQEIQPTLVKLNIDPQRLRRQA